VNRIKAYAFAACLWAVMALVVARYTLGDSSWGQDGVVMLGSAFLGARVTGRHLAQMSDEDDE
jgi:hypothetical protein